MVPRQGLQRTRVFYLAMAVLIGGVLLASRVLAPPRAISLCAIEIYTGFPCITTGLTRAFHAISQGQLRDALVYHPLSLFLYVVAVFHMALAALRFVGWRFRLIRAKDAVQVMFWGILILLFAFWIPRVLVMAFARKLIA